ncbi:Swt1 family HEPN domain-containing protein [Rubrivirga sp. IMCC43871]|uniref:Swt1 family HEPN domain-containing protein n=1 Tax=Rubrivirga sp. IMCC43871 TaxID=3391575 RepID=UPI003990188A
MALSNRDRIDRGFLTLSEGLRPYFEREMEHAYGTDWESNAASTLHHVSDPNWNDPQTLLRVMIGHWRAVFDDALGHNGRNYVSELMEVRNDHAHHKKQFSSDDTHRALDTMHRLLDAISAPEEASALDEMRNDVMRQKLEEQARWKQRQAKREAELSGKPQAGLSPWRDVVEPHPDVQKGQYSQAEFAADLWQVYKDEGSLEYRKPDEFFRRTYLTEGLRNLLIGALKRLNGAGGDPVIELQTNFGGGKTHSMLALFHLFSGVDEGSLPGLEPVLTDAGVVPPPGVKRAVLVGNKIPPGAPLVKDDGTEVRTLWGELAWQLGGRPAYELVRAADETGTNPGDQIDEVFRQFGPALILIDEWVAYARQLHDEADLPGGSFDTQFTFAQTLSEAVKAVPNAMLVVSIPSSDIEVGGQRGKDALIRLKNAIGRVQSPWRPATAEESFEIVRRRLFQPIPEERYPLRDAVVRSFIQLYNEQKKDFPDGCCEQDYADRMKAAYPIHPELFRQLYEEWGSLERFQRTRGVLRLMAQVIHTLWDGGDNGLLILPASVPLHAPTVQGEIRNYLNDNWGPILEKDVDGEGALPLRIDEENASTLGRYSAARRVARTVFMGTVPRSGSANPGITDARIRLGSVQPGETTATFGDALRRLSDQAAHLYENQSQYWFDEQPNVNRLAAGRAGQIRRETHRLHEEIERRLAQATKAQRGPFHAVHVAPSASSDVPDDQEARLVVLGPAYPHSARDTSSKARAAASEMLTQRGDAQRLYRNALVYLAPDEARVSELRDAVAQYLAWSSIVTETDDLGLTPFARSQAASKKKTSGETVEQRVRETYVWLLAPMQEDPKSPEVEWTESRLQGGEALAERAAKKLVREEALFTEFAPVRLQMAMERYGLWRGEEAVRMQQLAEDFARYLYLPRLRSSAVLVDAVQTGVQDLAWTEYFAYASAKADERYMGLKAGERTSVYLDAESLLVTPAAAQRQRAADAAAKQPEYTPGEDEETPEVSDSGTTQPEVTPEGDSAPAPKARRFHGSVALDAVRMGRDAGQIAEAVVQHLAALGGANVRVTLEIHAEVPDGAPDNVVRTVTENARTLKFDQAGFEDE